MPHLKPKDETLVIVFDEKVCGTAGPSIETVESLFEDDVIGGWGLHELTDGLAFRPNVAVRLPMKRTQPNNFGIYP